MATPETIASYLDKGESSDREQNVFKQVKKRLGIPESAKYLSESAYGERFLPLASLEERVR